MNRWLVLVSVACVACGDDAGTPIDAPGCPKLWTVTGSSAVIDQGLLTLTAPTIASGVEAQIVQHGIEGDFDASFTLTMWTAGGTGAYLQAVVAEDVASPASFFSAAIGTSPTVGLSAAMQPGTADIKPTTAVAATLRFVRASGTLTATATAGGTTARAMGTYAADPLTIGLQLGTNAGAVGAPTTAVISNFVLTAPSGTATGDAFDCDSLE